MKIFCLPSQYNIYGAYLVYDIYRKLLTSLQATSGNIIKFFIIFLAFNG